MWLLVIALTLVYGENEQVGKITQPEEKKDIQKNLMLELRKTCAKREKETRPDSQWTEGKLVLTQDPAWLNFQFVKGTLRSFLQ